VVDALMKVFDQQLFDWELPRVMVDTWEHGRTVVVWEEGPYGWTWVFPCGGMLNGSRWEVPEAQLPKGVWVEPNDGCVVSVYQEVAERQSAEVRGKRFASSTFAPLASADPTAGHDAGWPPRRRLRLAKVVLQLAHHRFNRSRVGAAVF
jgi:hypothetical protein